jgi:hypothetical protein
MRCGKDSCLVVAAYAVRSSGTSRWVYACGWHLAQATRDRVAKSVHGKAITEKIG